MICLWCSRGSLVEQLALCSPFPPRALPRFPGTTVSSAIHGSMAVARRTRFASATHRRMRPPWASRVPLPIRFQACRALRPRQILRRSRHTPRLLVHSRFWTGSATAQSRLRGSILHSRCGLPVARDPIVRYDPRGSTSTGVDSGPTRFMPAVPWLKIKRVL